VIFAQVDNDEEQTSGVIVVIEPDNLERMKTGDPITIEPGTRGGVLRPAKYPQSFGFIICFEADPGPVYELVQKGNTGGLLKYLMRGYRYKPEDGKKAKLDQKRGKA
jgi:hypothetical protein